MVSSMDWPTGKNVLNVIAIMNVCLLGVFVAITFVLNGAHLAIVPLVLVVPLQNLLLLPLPLLVVTLVVAARRLTLGLEQVKCLAVSSSIVPCSAWLSSYHCGIEIVKILWKLIDIFCWTINRNIQIPMIFV